jgi:hypothetical protein
MVLRRSIRIALIVVALLSNAALAFVALSPAFVSYADVVPRGIRCAECDTPDVQHALVQAAKAGRQQIIGTIASNKAIVLGSAALNVGVLALALLLRRSP